MPNSGGELKLHLSTINVTKTLAIGYCVPENATIEVQLREGCQEQMLPKCRHCLNGGGV